MYKLDGITYDNIQDYQRALKLSKDKYMAYEPWTKELDNELIRLSNNYDVTELCQHFRRTKGAIRARLKKLNIIKGEEIMTRKRNSRNSNLFSIDLEGIEAILADANAPLINKSEEILGFASGYPNEISNLEEAEQLKAFLKTLRSQTRDLSNARLSDGRPFTDAAKVVKEWFGKTESRLKAADKRLSSILATYTSEIQRKADEIMRKNAEIEALNNNEPFEENKVLGVTISGEPLVTVNHPQSESNIPLEEVPKTPDVELVWQTKSFNRDVINLEILRPFLTDYAITLAINAYVKQNGPKQLEGVVYEQIIPKKI